MGQFKKIVGLQDFGKCQANGTVHYQTGYTPLYAAEGCYKYNYRDMNMFGNFAKESMQF